jgi:hypothetical protein
VGPLVPDDPEALAMFTRIVADADAVWAGGVDLDDLHDVSARFAVPFETVVLMFPSIDELADSVVRARVIAAGIEGGIGRAFKKTPYQLAVDHDLPTYFLRLLLRAAPDLDPAELRRLNWAERRTAMFVAFAAVAKQATAPPLLTRLRVTDKQLVKHVVSFL